jgi:uncharacterized GH25 family protein
MKMKMKIVKALLVFCLGVLLPAVASAHFIWIETAAEGRQNKKQEIKIFYGEYSDNLREKTDGRFSEVNNFTAWVVSPGGQRTKLECVPQADHYLASFIPTEPGRYGIVVVNTEREVVDWTKYNIGIIRPTYYSAAIVTVPIAEPPAIAKELPQLTDFSVMPVHSSNVYKTGKENRFSVSYKSQPSIKQKVMVFAPNGWSKELETDEQGLFKFTAPWEGRYIIEAIYSENVAGNFKGKDYAATRHRTIYTFEIAR